MAMYESPLGPRPQIEPLKKKRPGDIANVSASLGIPAGVVRPQGPQAMHSPAQPGLTQPATPKPITAYGAGQATRDAIGSGVDTAVKVGSTLAAPSVNFMHRAGEFGRGLFGAAPPPAQAGAAGGPTLPRPSFNNVVGAAATIPARKPASQLASGGTGSAGGVPASPSPTALKPGDVNTFTGVNGVTRPVPGMQAQATGGVQAQSFGGLAMPTLAAPVAAPVAAPAPRQDMGVAIPRPVRADAFNVRQANERNDKIADTIESELFRNSFAAGRGSRSARQAQADMLQTLAQLGGKQLDVAANVAGGDRDASVRGDITGMEQSGANQRALLSDTGETTRTGMVDAGETNRSTLKSLAEINRPSTITDADGHLLRVSGRQADSVIGIGGKPVTLDTPQRAEARKSLQEAYAKLGESAAAFLPLTGVAPTDADIGTARIRAAQIAGYELKRDKSGAMFVQIGGEWMPL